MKKLLIRIFGDGFFGLKNEPSVEFLGKTTETELHLKICNVNANFSECSAHVGDNYDVYSCCSDVKQSNENQSHKE